MIERGIQSTVENIDCMVGMARYPDKWFDLAVVDIPYGINVGKMAYLQEMKTTIKQKNGSRTPVRKKTKYTLKDWDSKPPPQEYYNELVRISKYQIIFGIEYVDWVGVGTGRIRWNKGVPKGVSFKGYEVAYCSLITDTKELPLLWSGMMQAYDLSQPMKQQGNKRLNEKRIHPTQKPVLLYIKLLQEYARQSWRIIDTHVGSRSSQIAAHKLGLDYTGFEIDTDYYNDGAARFEGYVKQQIQTLF